MEVIACVYFSSSQDKIHGAQHDLGEKPVANQVGIPPSIIPCLPGTILVLIFSCLWTAVARGSSNTTDPLQCYSKASDFSSFAVLILVPISCPPSSLQGRAWINNWQINKYPWGLKPFPGFTDKVCQCFVKRRRDNNTFCSKMCAHPFYW